MSSASNPPPCIGQQPQAGLLASQHQCLLAGQLAGGAWLAACLVFLVPSALHAIKGPTHGTSSAGLVQSMELCIGGLLPEAVLESPCQVQMC